MRSWQKSWKFSLSNRCTDWQGAVCAVGIRRYSRRMLQILNLGRVSIIFCTPELCKSPPAFSSVREQLVAGAWNMEIQICKVNIGNQLAWILGWKSNHFHWRLLLLDVQELTTVRWTLQVGGHLCNFVADSISQKQYFKIDSWACCFERKSHGIL